MMPRIGRNLPAPSTDLAAIYECEPKRPVKGKVNSAARETGCPPSPSSTRKFRNTIFIIRGGYVLVDEAPVEECPSNDRVAGMIIDTCSRRCAHPTEPNTRETKAQRRL
jgi:hypothetical protein